MPLTPEEKKQRVIAAGLNPDEYTFVEDTRVDPEIEKVFNEQNAPIATNVPQHGGAGEAFGKSFLRSLVPTGGAMGGMAAAARLPIPHPIGKGIAILGGGLLGSLLGGAAQKPVIKAVQGEEGYNKGLENLHNLQQQHPFAGGLGEVAPMLPFMGPSGLGTGLKGLSKIIGLNPATVSGAEKAAMGNMALGPGLGAGVEASRELVQDDKMSPARIAAYGLGGLATMTPTKLGARMLGEGSPIQRFEDSSVGRLPEGKREYIDPVPENVVPKEEAIAKPKVELTPQDPEVAKELQGKEVKPSLVNDQNPVVKSGEPENRVSLPGEEEINPDPTEKFYQPAKAEPYDSASTTPEQQRLATKRGVDLTQQPEIISDITGRQARGVAIPAERRAIVSDIATPDTGYHEVGHNYLADLKRSKNPRDVEFYNAGIKAAGTEEKLAQALGERSVVAENRPLRTWVDDALQNVKRVTKLGTADDVKLLTRRFRDDRPFVESPELHGDIKNVQRLYSEDLGGAGGSSHSADKKEPSKGLGPLTSTVDRIAEKGPAGQKVAKAIEATEIENRNLNGKITNSFIEHAKKIKDKEGAARYIWESRYGTPKVILNAADKALIDGPINKTYKLVHEEQRINGPLINSREAIDNPNLKGPSGVSKDVLDTIINKPENHVRRQALKKDFIEHQIKFDPEVKGDAAKAEDLFKSFLAGFSPAQNGSTSHFNALRKAEGIGIPWSWMEKDPVKLLQRYGSRVSRDLSYYRNIENNKEVSALFGLSKEEGIEPFTGREISSANKRLIGEHTADENLYSAVEHFVRGLILGPLTGVKNTVSTFAQVLPYVPARDIPKIAEAFRYIKQGFADSMDKGVNRHSITSLESGVTEGGIGKVAETLRNLGDGIRKYTGANAIEQWTRAHNMALGEIMTRASWGRAAKGDIEGVKFLNQFAPGMNPKTTALTDDIVKEAAARFVERVQGTYGSRGLPSFLLEPSSPWYWLMSLSKWSVEKGNVIKQDVINPALTGKDFGPLIRYTLGGLATGELVREMTTAINGGKKAQTPDIKEIQATGNQVDDWAFKSFELANLAGLGGIISDIAGKVGAAAQNNKVSGYTIPSVEIAQDTFAEIKGAINAIREGQNPVEILLELGNNILTDNIQALRLAHNQTHPEEIDRLNKYRDMRVHGKLEGKNIPAMDRQPDRYTGKAEKDFKRATSQEAAREIYNRELQPKLSALTPSEQKEAKQGLKRNSYQTVPEKRVERESYLNYISQTQGEGAAKDLLADKRRQDLVNRKKRELLR